MNDAAMTALLVGGLLAVVYGAMAAAPDAALLWLRRFPRHRPCAWVLTAVALVWAGWLLYHTPLGPFERFKPSLVVLTPLAVFLLGRFVDELLAARALGGLLLLVPAPILDAVRWHDSVFRYVLIVLAYVMVVKGIALVLSPYLFRKGVELVCPDRGRTRLVGGVGLALGLFIVGLGVTVFR